MLVDIMMVNNIVMLVDIMMVNNILKLVHMMMVKNIVKLVLRRVNPTCRSGRFRSDPHRISSESGIFHKKQIGFDRVFVGFLSVGFRPRFRRNSTEPDEIRVGSGRISIVFRRIPGRIWSNFNRVPSNSDEIRIGIRPIGSRQKLCRIRSKLFRSDGIRSPLSHMGTYDDAKEYSEVGAYDDGKKYSEVGGYDDCKEYSEVGGCDDSK